MRPFIGVYNDFPEIIEWLNHTLCPIEQGVFDFYRSIQHIVRMVDLSESAGKGPHLYAALSAIREYNEANGNGLTYEEVRDRSPQFLLSDIGDWVAYVEDARAADRLMMREGVEDLVDILHIPDADIRWLVVWCPAEETALTCRTPFAEERMACGEDSPGMSFGLRRGDRKTFTLPPELEAALGSLSREELFATST